MKYYKLHLIRHGLTQGNLDGRYIGSGTDLPLCAEGRAQLEELKAKFQYPDVPLVFCSPMLRAQQTAEVLFPNAKLTILQDLREMNFGKFENRPITELVKDPEFAQWMDPTSRTNPDGAEDRKAFYDRTNVMLMKLFEYQRDHEHDGQPRFAAAQAGGMDDRPRLWLQPAPGRRNVDARPYCRSF